MPESINWSVLAISVEYYKGLGYEYIEVPWRVPFQDTYATKPPFGFDLQVTAHSDVEMIASQDRGSLLASGEQGFLYRVRTKNLHGRYVTLTPCFREEYIKNDLHRPWFAKVELFDNVENNKRRLLDDALNFYQKYIPTCFTHSAPAQGDPDGMDISVYVNANDNPVELGSYGTRTLAPYGTWTYGTGCAEPRLSEVLNMRRE